MNSSRKPSLLALFLLISFPAVDALLFSPALTAIAKQYAVSAATAQDTITWYLLAYAFSQLLYGPLCNLLGARSTVYWGLTIASLGSLAAALASYGNNFSLLILARIVMAIGAGVGLSMSFTVINHISSGGETRRHLAITSLAFPIMPGIATFIGGLLTQFLGWASCFYFLFIYGLIMMYFCRHLPDRSGFSHNHLIMDMLKAAKNTRLWLASILFALCSGIAYLYAGSGPIVVIKTMQYSPSEFGTFNLLVVATYIMGNLLAAALARRATLFTTMYYGWTILAIGAVALWWSMHHSTLMPWNFLVPVSLFFIGLPLVFTNASILGTNASVDTANNSAIMSFLTMIGAVLALHSIHWFNGSIPYLFIRIMLILTGLILISLLAIGLHRIIKRSCYADTI